MTLHYQEAKDSPYLQYLSSAKPTYRQWIIRALQPLVQGRNPAALLDPSATRFLRRPRLAINTFISHKGHLSVYFEWPNLLENESQEFDFQRIIFNRYASGWGEPDPNVIFRVRSFAELVHFAIRRKAGDRYLRSAKLLVLACYNYIEWLIEACSDTLDIRRHVALYLTLEDGPDGEPEITSLGLRAVDQYAEDRRQDRLRAEAEAARLRDEQFVTELPDKYHLTPEQIASAYLRANCNITAAHRIIKEAHTSESTRPVSYQQLVSIIRRLQRVRPQLFSSENTPAEG